MLTPYEEGLVVGSRFLDRYQIISVVGRGSMGIVYKARHELMGRLVAIKMLRGQLQLDEKSIKRFEREARAASRLDHPNAITVHDFGLTAQRQPYLVMDFANGITLYEIQKRERVLAPERAVKIFSQVCDALHHAHLHGVIHRDLKPSNIMILNKDEDPNFVKVFDLGVAKIAWGEEEYEKEALTNTGEVCGSPIYLSPEQCKHEELDHRTDIYSLGVVMYELLTGTPPFLGETVYDTIYLHVHDQPPPFSQVTDLPISSRLEAIVLKALSKKREDRQQSMQEVKWELLAAMEQGEPALKVLPPPNLNKGTSRAVANGPVSGKDKSPDQPSRAALISERMSMRNGSNSNRPDSAPPLQPPPGAPSGSPTGKLSSASSPAASISNISQQVSSDGAVESGATQKPHNILLLTVAISCVVSIVVTLGIVTFINAGKNGGKAPQSAVTAEMPAGSASHVVDNKIAATLAPVVVAESATGARKSQKGKVRVEARANSLEPLDTEPGVAQKPRPLGVSGLPPGSADNPTKSQKKIQFPDPPVVIGDKQGQGAGATEPGAARKAAMEPKADPFFSIFARGQSPESSAGEGQVVRASNRTMSTYTPVASSKDAAAAPSNSDNAPPAAPAAPAAVDQAKAVSLNNEAVSLMASSPREAITRLEKALQVNPGYAKARKNLGRAWHNLANQQRANGDTFAAVNSYRRSLNILTDALGAGDPDTEMARQDYENLLQTAGAR